LPHREASLQIKTRSRGRRPDGQRGSAAVRREGVSRASQTIILAQSQCAWTPVGRDFLDISHM
jgi:hypothetical protein